MKTKEIRDKDTGALNEELARLQKHIFDLRSQAVTEKLEDPTQIGKAKKDIARVKTILRQRQLDEQKKAQQAAAAAK
jgi:large subunit ribosomal protein L29